MKYQHILVALELTEENKVLINKAIAMAETFNADVSLIHVDGAVGEVYTQLIDIQQDPTQKPLNQHANELLLKFQNYTKEQFPDFPIKYFWVGTGSLGSKLKKVIEQHQYDLLICGHHHDFWSNMVSYSRDLINKSPIDILVVPMES